MEPLILQLSLMQCFARPTYRECILNTKVPKSSRNAIFKVHGLDLQLVQTLPHCKYKQKKLFAMFFGSTILMSKNTELDFSVYSPLTGLDASQRRESHHFIHEWDIPKRSCVHKQNHLVPSGDYAKIHVGQNYGYFT